MLTASSSSIAFCRAVRRVARPWTRSVSSIWLPIVNTGLSAVIGSWKMSAISAPRTCCISRSASGSRSRPLNRSRPVGDPARRLHQPHDRQRRHRLAAAGLADQAQRFARRDVEADVDDRRHEPAADVEAGGEVLDRQQSGSLGSTDRLVDPDPSPNPGPIRHRSPCARRRPIAQRVGDLADGRARLDGRDDRRHEVRRRRARPPRPPSSAARHAAASRDARTARTRSTCRRSTSGSICRTSIAAASSVA